jgi:tetratricopeptide (TPR) repeat protein
MLYASAALASAEEDYKDAVELFKQGKYQAAIAKFETAKDKGIESAALYYNLGSAYFKIEKYSVSKDYFNRVVEYPDQRALAEYNLGLIALKENNIEQALNHFDYAATNSKDKKIIDSSNQKIANLTGIDKPWRVRLLGYIGYDDNISVTPDNLALGVDDTFYNLSAYADYVFHGRRKRGWLVDASYFRIDFSDSDDFDQDFYTIGLRNEHRLSSWDTIVHLRTGRSSFGGDDLQSFYKLDVLGARPLSNNQKLILQYRFDDFTSKNSIYDYLEGWRQRGQIRYVRNTKNNNQQLYYELELNNRGDLVTSFFSYEYSPTRHTIGGKYTHKFSNRWFLTGDLSYRESDFPASATLNRDDSRWTLGLLVDYRIDSTFLVKGNVKYIENDSTVDVYTYDKTVISLGLSKLF